MRFYVFINHLDVWSADGGFINANSTSERRNIFHSTRQRLHYALFAFLSASASGSFMEIQIIPLAKSLVKNSACEKLQHVKKIKNTRRTVEDWFWTKLLFAFAVWSLTVVIVSCLLMLF